MINAILETFKNSQIARINRPKSLIKRRQTITFDYKSSL